jgi:DNA-binding NtrC family response regulator
MKQVLVVDDEPAMRLAVEASLARCGWSVETASGTAEALGKFERGRHRLVITDVRMPDGDGMELLRRVRADSPATAVVLLTAFADVSQAVAAMKDGAADYLVKPVSLAQLEATAARMLARWPGVPKPARESGASGPIIPIIGKSAALRAVLEQAEQAAASDADVLIEAESGTGKELLARLIHQSSARRQGPLVAVNCAAFPDTLLESELFGHGKGAFTGAAAARPGRFELADGGTLLLDEISEMPLPLQPKLLRAVQEREFERLGETRTVRVDLRVVATTNRHLLRLVEEGRFRADLYYRLHVIPLVLPPLRERREDIPLLADHFLARHTPAGRELRLAPEALAWLEQADWPGNVRELENCLRRGIALTRGDEITAALLRGAPGAGLEAARLSAPAAGTTLEELERQLLVRTLAATGGNRSQAAVLLGISLRTVRNKIRTYGLPPRSLYVPA